MFNGNEKIPESETDQEKLKRLESENRSLRKIYWFNHGCDFHYLYGDDGELQCSKCMIDFKRDTIDSIVNRRTKMSIDKIGEATEIILDKLKE